MTRTQLLATLAPSIKVTIAGQDFVGTLRQFSTGSIGYNVSAKVQATDKDGKLTAVKCQVGLNITVVGSKEMGE